ncbi:hypothetical protein [Actinokineospora enzanensis]|uniref:hypothetical protein n=1 Tax=Actinokineospora enzanensis TaxID=155975 RepID=UPI00039F3B63|nr:hypothetical protein [Actinokineospora enzanensis]
MLEIGNRRRAQPPPPAVLFEALTKPHRDPTRPWLLLLKDEQEPQILEAVEPSLVVWSSLWTRRPDAVIRFTLEPGENANGTALHWALLVDEPEPDASLVGHLRKRLNELIHRDLRHSFGQ